MHFACPEYKAIRPWKIIISLPKKRTLQVRLGDVVKIQGEDNHCVVMDFQMFPRSCK